MDFEKMREDMRSELGQDNILEKLEKEIRDDLKSGISFDKMNEIIKNYSKNINTKSIPDKSLKSDLSIFYSGEMCEFNKSLDRLDIEIEDLNKYVKIVDGDIYLIFNSTPKYFLLELEGIKNYTIRDTDNTLRFEILDKVISKLNKLSTLENYLDLNFKIFVQINSKKYGSFKRRMKYVYKNKYNQYILNW